MKRSAAEIYKRLRPLIGCKLTRYHRVYDMLMFGFGDYSLHVTCPWRIEKPNGYLVAGLHDIYLPPKMERKIDEGADYVAWCDANRTFRDLLLKKFFGPVKKAGGFRKATVVENVDARDCGDIVLTLTGGNKLVLFVCRTRGESWRLLDHRKEKSVHFVV